MNQDVASKVAAIAEKMAGTPKQKKASEKQLVIDELKKQKGQFKKAIKNGYTKKDIIEQLSNEGVTITARDLAEVLGTRSKKRASKQLGVTAQS